MIIGIDGNEANEVRRDIGERVGVNSYAFEILWAVYRENNRKKGENNYLVYLRNVPDKDLPPENPFWRYKVISGGGMWIIRKLLPALLKSNRPDVFFSPGHYLPPFTLMPKVCTIHDLGYLKFSEHLKKYDFWQLKYWTAISITISKYIISVSESTKKDIVRHYHKASKKISVAYHGYDKSRFNTQVSDKDVRRVRKIYGISSDYILFLSTLKPSKNIEGLIEGYRLLKTRQKLTTPTLVLAGKKGWLYNSVFEKVKNANLSKSIIFTDFVAEKDKPALIYGAKVFILPSLWEGFGMDILHAMACGTPVVTSDIASMPEVAGKAGVYVDPSSAESISKGLERVLKMTKKEYNSLVKLGVNQADKFSWEMSARKTLKVLEKAAN